MSLAIEIPNDWHEREHQKPICKAFREGVRRAVAVWHRRAGKDSTAINFTATEMFRHPGLYWHCGPTQKQVRKFVWNNIDREGRRVIDQAFPSEIRKRKNDSEMLIETVNGSIWQCIGSDNYDSLVGANPRGVVFSEWSICDPHAWDLIRPILVENNGWVIFIYTPRGKNHGYFLYQMARTNPDWFCELLTVDDTGLITPEQVQAERDAGMPEEMIEQEFYCSFEAFNVGAIFGKQMQSAWKERRIGHFPPDPALPVYTFWDLGINDQNAIWMVQAIRNEIRLVGYYENYNEAMPHYFKYLNDWAREHHCSFAEHWAPHDIEVREYTSGKTRKETALKDHGWRFQVTPQLPVSDQIEAGRGIFPKIFIHETACQDGINALASFEREFDEKRKVFTDRPVHNWASHGSSAFMNMAVNFKDRMFEEKRPQIPTGPVQAQITNPFDG